MTLRQTHTFAELEVTRETYDEIAGKLREAGYIRGPHTGAIDMHGIGLVRERSLPPGFEPADLEEAVAASFASGAAAYAEKLREALSLAPEHDEANPDRQVLGRLIAKAKEVEGVNLARIYR